MPKIEIKTVRKYVIENIDENVPDWELTYDNQNHVLGGSELVKILTKSINEIYAEDGYYKSEEWILLKLGGKIIKKLGELAD